MTTVESVAEELKCYGFENVEFQILEHVTTFINMNDKDIEDIVSELVAFAGNINELKITSHVFNEFKVEFQKRKPVSNKKLEPTPNRHELSLKTEQDYNIMAAYGGTPATPIQSAKRVQSTPDNSSSKRRSNILGTPTPVTNTVSPLSNSHTPIRRRDCLTPSSKKYTKRSNKAEMVMSHGDTKAITSWEGGREDDVIIIRREQSSTENEKYRYMFQKLQDRAHVLDRRIEDLSDSIRQLHLPEMDEFINIREKTTTEVYVCGQICCDCEGRLNTESVMLQGDICTSHGRAIPVNISTLSSYSLFPGQTVVMKAQNEEGNLLKATECYIPEPQPTSQITECHGISVMVACGPFTPNNTNDFAPLDDLLEQVQNTSPDILILMGPFLDTENQVLEHSIESYDVTFRSLLDTILSKTTNIRPAMQLVIVSSHKDLHHEPIYPTPPYNVGRTLERTHFVMNPCTLNVDGVRIGLTATDVLFQMAANEISWDADTKDRMLRLSEHLLSQRSYFPMYPPISDFNLDLELNEEHSTMSASPHLMLVSSNFNQFIKVGSKTIFANPGRLCKGEGGGTYMKFIIDPIQNKDNILDEFKAEIIRI